MGKLRWKMSVCRQKCRDGDISSKHGPIGFTGRYTFLLQKALGVTRDAPPGPVPAGFGSYWVCGNKAYHTLPVHFSGSCYLAWLLPPTHVVKQLHEGKIRNVRDTSKPQAEEDAALEPMTWATFPSNRRLRRGVIRLQGILEIIANETATIVTNQATELKQLRQLALQNRMALDILLAAQGGTCALIGQECCVFVNDTYKDTFNRAAHLRDIARERSDEGSWTHDWFDSLFSWFSSLTDWLKGLLKEGVMILLMIMFIFCVFKLSMCIMSKCARATSKPKGIFLSLQERQVLAKAGTMPDTDILF
ncbi:syncytin-1-like [Malaclemys terrapin pileata]|uniref:syncytin-1-like n=1 Tax=Malaclemys terrapin pileata TaxID=2991368 RepID=UPI0023A87333|nr:syncytin-1-like [Malaclemys terrapin pileata]